MHSQKRSAGSLGQFDKILPAVGIVAGVPHDALDLFVVHKAVKTAHAMAFDEGDHVVFYRAEIVRNGRHIRKTAIFLLYSVLKICANAPNSLGLAAVI